MHSQSRRFATSRRPMSGLVTALFTGLLGMVFVLGSIPAQSADKDKGPPKVTKKVGVLVNAASDAIKAKQFDVANAKLNEAAAVEKITDYDRFQIDEFRTHLLISQASTDPNKYAEALVLLEKSLQSPYIPPETVAVRPKQIVGVAFNAKDYPKSIEYGNRWLTEHADDLPVAATVGNAYYLIKDYKGALGAMKTVVAIAEKAGEAPKEQYVRVALSSAGNLQDEPAILNSYEKLLRYYPNQADWARYLSRFTYNEKSEQVMLQWFRLMAEVGALARPNEYVEYAQTAISLASSAEAARVLQAGFDSKVLGVDSGAQQHKDLLANARKKAEADKAGLAAEAKLAQASKSATGESDAGLGLAYFSHAMYDEAVTSLESGLAKGGLKNPDRFRMALAIAYLKKGDREKSRASFQAVPADSVFARAATAWAVRTYN